MPHTIVNHNSALCVQWCVCACVCAMCEHGYMHTTTLMWRSEGSLGYWGVDLHLVLT